MTVHYFWILPTQNIYIFQDHFDLLDMSKRRVHDLDPKKIIEYSCVNIIDYNFELILFRLYHFTLKKEHQPFQNLA